MPAKNKKTNKSVNKDVKNAPTEQPKELPVQLPAYKQIDFTAPPAHLEVLYKKMRALKKKLRRIEDAEKQEVSKRTPEQLTLIAEKGNITRSLREFEEIEKSLQKLDLTVPLRLWVGIFFAAAATGDSALNDLCTILLPPQNPPPSHSPLRELEHACQVAERFLEGASAELFNDGTPVTFAQVKEKVVQFLNTPESELIVQPAAVDTPAPVQENTAENFAAPNVETASPSNFVNEGLAPAEEPASETPAPEATETRDLPAATTEPQATESPAAPQPAAKETPADQQPPASEEVKSESDGKDRRRGGRRGGRGRGQYNRNREDGEGRGEGRGEYRNYKNRENGDYNNEGNGSYKPRGSKPQGRGGNKNYVRRGSPNTGPKNQQAQGGTTQ